MNATTMTLEEIRLVGLRALYRDLGAVGLVRFLQQFETGHGDYTTERHRWLDEYTVPDVVRQIRERKSTDKGAYD